MPDFQKDVDSWKAMLEDIQRWTQELVRARIRPVLAALYVIVAPLP